MTAPASSGSVYGDFAGLEKLKSSVRQNDPAAVRQVAKQFESLFARMLIKSMRDAIGRDPIFGSDQAQTYQGMFDDQLSLELTRGHGLGLADMLVRQLRQGAGASAMPAQSATGAQGRHRADLELPRPTPPHPRCARTSNAASSGRYGRRLRPRRSSSAYTR